MVDLPSGKTYYSTVIAILALIVLVIAGLIYSFAKTDPGDLVPETVEIGDSVGGIDPSGMEIPDSEPVFAPPTAPPES